MKKIVFVLLMPMVVWLSGCEKVDEKTQFTMAYNQSVTIESTSGIHLPFNIMSPEVETDAETTFEVNDTRKDLIEEILLTSLELTVVSPASEDFSFLESISIYLNADGLGERKIAWHDQVPNNSGNTLALSVTESDLKEYIKKDRFTIRVNTVTDEALSSDHEINVALELFVDAKILGQ